MTIIGLPNTDLLDLEPWEASAVCAKLDSAADFYPDLLTGSAAEAKLTCGWCPVRAECLDFALRHMDSVEGVGYWGIWAGTTERERRVMHRLLKRNAKLEAAA